MRSIRQRDLELGHAYTVTAQDCCVQVEFTARLRQRQSRHAELGYSTEEEMLGQIGDDYALVFNNGVTISGQAVKIREAAADLNCPDSPLLGEVTP